MTYFFPYTYAFDNVKTPRSLFSVVNTENLMNGFLWKLVVLE